MHSSACSICCPACAFGWPSCCPPTAWQVCMRTVPAAIRAYICTWVSLINIVRLERTLSFHIFIRPSLSHLAGYMLLYLTAMQAIAQFATHAFNTSTVATLLTGLLVLATSTAGGFAVHLAQLPSYWQWVQLVSPQRWLLPLLAADEYSAETLANTAGQQLCRNKQVEMTKRNPMISRRLRTYPLRFSVTRSNTRRSSYSIRARRRTVLPYSPTISYSARIMFCCWATAKAVAAAAATTSRRPL